MAATQEYIDRLVTAPSETLAVELKGWLDPAIPDDAAKIVKTCVALHNYGGGFLVLGFDDDGDALSREAPADRAQVYHPDRIQSLVARHASGVFEVRVRWGARGSDTFPVIEVVGGARAPVAIRSPLVDANRVLLPEHKVYCRSLQANKQPSTTEATWQDSKHIVETCFDNREADIGRFVRRHLTGIDSRGRLCLLRELG